MKYFVRYSLLALLVMLTVVISVAIVPASAATNVIYISDNGTGDGSSASSPLGPELVERVPNDADTTLLDDGDPSNDYSYYVNRTLYMNSVLYQAAEKLSKTGGTLVLVGDVVLDYSKTYAGARTTQRDFYMPDHGNNEITITAQNGGRLVITEGTYLNLGGKTTFENMTFVSKTGRNSGDQCDSNLAICCGGYDTVFGDGLNCVYENSAGNIVTPSSNAQYLSISGTKRYGDLNYDTNVTINSGTWYRVYGGMYGNAGDVHRGDVTLNINGGTFMSNVIGGSRSNSIFHFGEVNVNVTGGTFNEAICASNNVGTGYKNQKATIKVSGGTFTSATWVTKHHGTLVSGCFDPILTVDFSEYPATSVGTISGSTVYYPTQMLSSVTMKTNSTNTLGFVGEEYEADGLSLTLKYTNNKTAVVEYTDTDKNFKFDYDNTKEGTSTVTGTYGGKTISGFSKDITVVKSPVPVILGAQISTQDTDAGLRFVAEMAFGSGDDHITVKDYGFIAWDSSVLKEQDMGSLEELYGVNEMTAYGTKFRAEYDKTGMYNTESKTTFSGVYGNIQLNDYAKDIIAIAYIEYEHDGRTYIEYSEPVRRSVLGVAQLAAEKSYEDVAWITTNIIDRYQAYTSGKTNKNLSVYDSENAERLRDIVVAEMNAMANYKWTPSTDVDLTESVTMGGNNYYGKYTYSAGTTYYGMAYVNNSKAEFEEFERHIKPFKDGTNVYFGPIEGVNDLYTSGTAPYNDIQTKKYKVDEKYHEITTLFPATDYTGMIVNVWNKVGTNAVWLTTLRSFIPSYGRGTLTVGDYSYTSSTNYTDTITNASGSATMNAAYAQCKRGDVVLARTTGGGNSIYMVMEDAVPGTNSLKLMQFGPTLRDKNGGKTHFYSTTMTFSTLYSNGYIPVTLPELATGCQSNTTVLVNNFDADEAMRTGKLSGSIQSNKQIISVNVKLSRNEGDGIFYDQTVYCNSVKDQNVNKFDLSCFDMSKILSYMVEGKQYVLTVSADIANEGQKTVVSHTYTKPLYSLDSMYASYENKFGADFSNMTQTVIDHMKEQMNVYWTPAETFYYSNLTGGTGFVPNTQFTKNVIYRGVTYSNMRATLEDFQSVLDKTPTYNSKLGVNVYTYTGPAGKTDWNWVMGNHCSASMYHAYQKVIRLHASSRGNPDMRLLGLEDIFYGVASYTGSLVKTYGAEALYESYALAEKGDFVYKLSTGGHTRLVQETHVVRDDTTGRIDPDKSYILMLEQTDTLESEVYGVAKNGESINWTPESGYDSTFWEHKYSFSLLATGDSAAIILRPTEFKTNESENHYIGLTRKATKSNLETATSGQMGIIESNYPILAVYATIELEDGTVYTATARALTNKNSYSVGNLFTSTQTTYNDNPGKYLYRPNYIGKSYTYTLKAELAVGTVELDRITVTAS